jgi:hypothetical protein
MNSLTNQNYDVYESFAQERQSRILKASNDARLLSSLSDSGKDTKSSKSLRSEAKPKLSNVFSSLILVIKRQPA